MSTINAKTHRKRLKVVSACGECRRKKTKCNGEKPCMGCIKANVECKYLHLPMARSTAPPAMALVQDRVAPRPASIDAIEDRLSVIEEILRALVASSTHGNNAPAAAVAAQAAQVSTGTPSPAFGAIERDQLVHIRERFHPSPTLHAMHYQNRHFARQQDDDDGRCIIPTRFHPYTPPQPTASSSTRLPPLHQRRHPPLSASSSTSSTSSSVSSPKLSAIRTLLNHDDDPVPTVFCSTQTPSPIPSTSVIPSFRRSV